MDRKQFDDLGDRCKKFEMAENARQAMPGIPLLARLDGRSFSSYTRGCLRPYDPTFGQMMIDTTKALVEEFQCVCGYTQSDEITLLWPIFGSQTEQQYPFAGRFQKIQSVVASYATAVFNRLALKNFPDKKQIPTFDCRSWSVPSQQDAVDVFVWRQADAAKNSLSMAARSVASHKELQGKGRKHQHDILHANGLNWNDYPAHQKRGVFVKRVSFQTTLSAETLARIPVAKRPPEGHMVTRSRYDVYEWELAKLDHPDTHAYSLFATFVNCP